MDPVSVAASVVVIAQGVLSTIQALSTTIDNIKYAPRQVQGLGSAAKSLEGELTRLCDDTDGLAWHDKIVDTVTTCNDTCVEIHDVLNKWSKRPSWVIGIFKQERLAAYEKQLNHLAAKMHGVFNVAQGLELIRQGTENGRKLDRLEKLNRLDDIFEALKAFQVNVTNMHSELQIARASNEKRKVIRGDYANAVEAEEAEKDRADLLNQLDRHAQYAEQDQALCDKLHKDVEAETGQRISGIATEDNSTALVGSFGIDAGKALSRQELSAITTKSNSFSLVGTWAGSLDLAALAALRSAGPSTGKS